MNLPKTNPEEANKTFINWLHHNPNNFSFWAPKLMALKNTGVYVPKSICIPVPDALIECFFFERKDDFKNIAEWTKDSVYPKVEEFFPNNTTLFIKNGCFSNKYRFRENCLVDEISLESFTKHICNIQYDSLCYDTGGNAEIIIREWIEPELHLGNIYNGMPLRPELRIFYDFDKKEILYSKNYWDWDYCHEGICRHEPDKFTYECRYDDMLWWLRRYNDKWIGIIDQALTRIDLIGRWSVDFILEDDRPVLIDMALAGMSAYWDPEKVI